jgi:AAA+ ATPase superfamily predicted ATPase
MEFSGREHELNTLNRFINKKTSSLLVIKGRRRIGKSRLIEEFAKPYKFYSLLGLAPTEKTTAQSQRDDFANQLSHQGFPNIKAQDWNDLFWLLADKTKKGRAIILLDEISWIGSKDPDFLGKLKNAWDARFKKNPSLILILCGSASSWIEKNILSSTGFVGRVSFTLTLEELPLEDCRWFWGTQVSHTSTMEKLKVLSVIGGIPRYLEEINPSLNAETNIKNMCFTKGAFLVDEFDRLFSNLFLRNSEEYKKIIKVLSTGAKEFKEISQALNIDMEGRTLEYLEELMLSGFVKRDYTWHLKDGKDSKLSKFRLSDNYLRFYLKYIEPNKTKIERNTFRFKSLAVLPGWDSIMALQFENLALNNREYIWQKLAINPDDIISENPFFQHKTTVQEGCQIDYLIQTRHGSLYICEIKFSKNKITEKVIDEVQEKIKKLTLPKRLSCRPVLIHANEVEKNVIERDYFSEIIDFSKIIS